MGKQTKSESNPINEDEKDREKISPKREDPAKNLQTETDFTDEEQKAIVETILEDYRVGIDAYAEWKAQKEKDLQHVNNEKPSVIEGLTKKEWMSDRNLGFLPGILDIYQATLLATCYNPDTIHFQATEENDTDNRDNLEKFAKWVVGPKEINFEPEVDDFINNRVSLGFSVFKIEWEITYEWVDERIPVWSKTKKPRVLRYNIETKKRRFERGRIKNIDDLDRLVLPSYGKSFQDLPFIIEVIPIYLYDIDDLTKRKIILDKFKAQKDGRPNQKLLSAPSVAAGKDDLRSKKAEAEGIRQSVDIDGRNFPLDIYEWYGKLEHNGKREWYRIWMEPVTQTFIAAKPLRKIRRDGKRPYVGGPLRRQPGQLRGGSLTKLAAPAINALNNNYNQTSDFQTVNNLLFGFANFDEGFTESLYEVDPGKIYSVEGNPSEAVYFPNVQRSLAWSYEDKKFLLEALERITGAASYFLTSKTPDTTATRDSIVEQKGETKFGLWVRRTQSDIVEAINMVITLYQDWAPPRLGKRVLGENGKQLIRNLSIDTLRGNYDAKMVPDLTAGSKAYEKQVMLWASEALNKNCVWMSPQVNPRGNWLLWKDTMVKQGIANPEHYLPPQPKQKMDDDEEAKNEFTRMMQGEVIDPPPEGVTPAVVRHLATHMRQKETEYQDLDEAYRTNFDAHLFATKVNYDKFMAEVSRQQQEMAVASQMVQNLEKMGVRRNPQQPPTNTVPVQQSNEDSGGAGTPSSSPVPEVQQLVDGMKNEGGE